MRYMSGLSSTARVTIRSVSGSGVECGTPGMAPREPAEADDLVVAGLGLADDDGLGDAVLVAGADDVVAGLDDAAEATAEAAEGAAAVPPTLAHEVSRTVAAAIDARGMVGRPRRTEPRRVDSATRRAVVRPCDMSSFCQPLSSPSHTWGHDPGAKPDGHGIADRRSAR
jgi:hypothetical protein